LPHRHPPPRRILRRGMNVRLTADDKSLRDMGFRRALGTRIR
jgi:hypothetical protein